MEAAALAGPVFHTRRLMSAVGRERTTTRIACMVRKSLTVDERLLDEALRLSGEQTYAGVVQRALGDYVRRIRAGRILALGGSGLGEGSLTEMRRDQPARRARTARSPR